VAPGDIFEIIAKHFDIGTAHLVAINAVRRDSPMIVHVGDTINLDPATIATIGDQNGVVYAHQDRLPDPHVPPHRGSRRLMHRRSVAAALPSRKRARLNLEHPSVLACRL
jgi:hypothetical protein